ncbi:MAG: LCP family protein [Defluviitaleaceae bacterium]|nr:LCP family protein [Defluviitaleaceae bacterium]
MKKNPMTKIAAIAGLFVASVFVIVLAVVLSYNFALGGGANHAPTGPMSSNTGSESESLSSGGQTDDYEDIVQDVNILLVGLDNHNLADIMLIAHFNGERGSVDVFSVPRDARVQFSAAQREELIDRGVRNPRTSNFRVNELVNNSGGRNSAGFEFARGFLGDMFGIEIHHHIMLTLQGFRNIVDAVGGIDMYVPYRLLYTGGLSPVTGEWEAGEIHIDIPQGWNHLNGQRAEQVVRFRNHPTADFFRIRMQQYFMQAFFEQALTLEGLTRDPLSLVTSFITHVDTDIGIIPEIRDYLQSGMLDMIDADNIGFHLIPIASSAGNYFIYQDQARQLVLDVMSGELE